MGHARGTAIGILAACFVACSPAAAASGTPAERVFATRVLPLLQARCIACHGRDPRSPAGGLDLTRRESLLRNRRGKVAVLPGDATRGSLMPAIRRVDPRLAMPPKENDRLSAEEIEAFRLWIAGGAPWPEGPRLAELKELEKPAGVVLPITGGQSPEWNRRAYQPADVWAYQPLRLVPPPGPARTAIDAFLARELRDRKLTPAPVAGRAALIRRATFSLTGLPPTPAETEAFLRDPAPLPAAFRRVTERLLNSPHYGEQMARHWLDVARYADSSGFANDYERGNAWRHRDYVVRAFNRDLPYDRFITEQLAGDEEPNPTTDALLATGFLRMGPWELTGMEVPRIARQRFLDDVTDSVGQVFLGHTLQCARCHDHKFDPVPTRDYYRIQAAFATTQFAERAAPFLPEENRNGFGERQALEERQRHYEALLQGLWEKEEAAARRWYEERKLPPVARQDGLRRGIPEERLAPAHVGLSPMDLGLERIARKGLERLRWELERYEPYALSVYSGHTPVLRSVFAPLRMPADPRSGELEATCVLPGGDPFARGAAVNPGVLTAAGDRELPSDVSGRRKALAAWITSPTNPLTGRVMVNRIWQWHFGQPLAGNPNNFGATGKKPTHPELLDWLAHSFVHGNPAAGVRAWSIQDMHRLILGSEAYQRASRHSRPEELQRKDPLGESYAVFRPRRLAAEELRDAMLAASGELNPELGGIPVRPEMNPEVARQPRQVMGTFAPAWEPSPLPAQRHRRSLYVLRLRGLRDPFLEVFNQPGSESSCEIRESSTISPQVFALFNGAESGGRALALAARLLAEKRSAADTVRRLYELTLGRHPTPSEVLLCREHWERMSTRHEGRRFERETPQRVIRREAVEENTGEKFVFEEVLPFASRFVPDLHPADVDARTRGLMEVCLVLFNSNEFTHLD